ncbi:YwqG family protein [Breznakia pachnodae]|uniref:Uncharacterized protein YwqG n=1 Tax=Breznakia pachnodae TaxID=265178 RepID=A0ABU0E374_9FIRM|nr:DUF1963 domain-containing protein [Breznakia pachnodae]MDQ0361347.1 uncharacterized protein YwqG [Breznakia pachnodae]
MKLPEILNKHSHFLESTLRLSNEITFEKRTTLPWDSKCGGCPYLENMNDYPIGANKKPMMFLAQLNLEEMPSLPNFPSKGLLQFYIEDNDCLGYDDKCTVRYIPEYKKSTLQAISRNPYEDQYVGHTPFNHEGKMIFTQREMLISTECDTFHDRFFDKVSKDEWNALYDVCYAEGSRVNGYPLFVQSPPEYYDENKYDLLLQLDVDDTCGIMFGDSGNCTFIISKEDLINLNFENVYYDWQCC